MNVAPVDKVFAGSIPQLYEKYLVPLIFEPYARDLAARISARAPVRILEIAAGTGVLTRALAQTLPAGSSIVATDLNAPMLECARAIAAARAIDWREADAMALPFEDASFDAVACQFGAMFFPDKRKAFSEAKRVLAPGGMLLFSVWDRIEDNEFADVATQALAAMFPKDPPRFLARTPHGYHRPDEVRADLARAGWTGAIEVATLAQRSRAASCELPAIAYCHGTPLRNEIEALDASGLERATAAVADALAKRFGRGPVDGKIQAHVVCAEA